MSEKRRAHAHGTGRAYPCTNEAGRKLAGGGKRGALCCNTRIGASRGSGRGLPGRVGGQANELARAGEFQFLVLAEFLLESDRLARGVGKPVANLRAERSTDVATKRRPRHRQGLSRNTLEHASDRLADRRLGELTD